MTFRTRHEMRHVIYRILIVTFGLSLAGCQMLGLRGTQQSFSDVHTADGPIKPTKEMSPAETAKICLTTARKMDEGGREAEAIGLYERAREHDPKLDVSARLAVLYDRAHDVSRAEAEYRRAVEAQPKNADLWNDYGYFQLQRDKLDEAEKCFQRALELKPKHARARNNLALTYGYQGRCEECLALFEKTLGKGAAQSNLGMILLQQRKEAEAAEAFRAALREQADLPQAHTMLAHLERGKPDSTTR